MARARRPVMAGMSDTARKSKVPWLHPERQGQFQQGGPNDWKTLKVMPLEAGVELQRTANEEGTVLQWIIYHAPWPQAPHFIARGMLYDYVGHHNSMMLNVALPANTVEELRTMLTTLGVIKLNIRKFTDPMVVEVWGPDPKTYVPGLYR